MPGYTNEKIDPVSDAPYRVPFSTQVIRACLRGFFRALFHVLSPITITGREHVPARGPYLVAINHVSTYDPPFALAFWPRPLEALGAVEIWSRPGQSTLARLYGGIQVHRGAYDRQMINTALAALQAGYPLLIAPEGGRTRQPGLRQALPGIAYLLDKAAEQAPIPVIPAGIVGTLDDYLQHALHARRPPLQMNIGAPLILPPIPPRNPERRQALQENTDLIMSHLAALLPPHYRGVYAASIAHLAFSSTQTPS